MRFEIYHRGNLIKRGNEVLGSLRWQNELMYVPSTTIELPITYREFLNGHDEMKIFVNDKCFWGIIEKIVEDKEDETITVYLEHIIQEWTYRQISVNNAIKDSKMNVVYKGARTGEEGGDNVSATAFTVFAEELGTMTNDRWVLRAGASGWTDDGNTLTVTADASKVKAEEGEYDVTFTAGKASVTVKATVKAEPKEVKRSDYVITANNFTMYTDETGKLSDAEYIKRANVKTYKVIEEGEEEEREEISLPITVDASSIRAKDGVYSVKFSTTYDDEGEEKELNISVSVTMEGDNFSDPTIADNISDIYGDMNFAYPGWKMNYQHDAGDDTIDYVYSRQNKLEALTKTMELTDNLFWRVRFVNEKVVDISPFGDKKQYIFSKKPSGVNNIRIISDPVITHDFSHVINLATVYSEKSDTGMSSMTLREVYMNPDLQIKGFPVAILRAANANTVRDYKKYIMQYPKLAPNNELEYCVVDEESVALEGGVVIEGTYAFNDLAPFPENADDEDKEITDKDRIKAAETAYKAVIKKLKQARRTYKIEFDTEEIPADIAPGDMVRFIYDNSVYILDECSNYLKKILSYDDWFVVTEISYSIGVNGAEVNHITLEKEIRIDRETRNE